MLRFFTVLRLALNPNLIFEIRFYQLQKDPHINTILKYLLSQLCPKKYFSFPKQHGTKYFIRLRLSTLQACWSVAEIPFAGLRGVSYYKRLVF
jgi:hypothetical protein